MEYVTLLAIIVGPILAVWVGIILQGKKEERDRQNFVLLTLVANRHNRLDPDVIKAMNSIDVIFARDQKIREFWKEYLGLVNQEPLNLDLLNSKFIELVHAMAAKLGYAGKITQIQVGQAYSPRLFGDQSARAEELTQSLLSVLTGKSPLRVATFEESADSNAQPSLLDGGS